MSSRSISSAGEGKICNLFVLVRRNVVTNTCLHSGFPVTISALMEANQIFVTLSRISACSVSPSLGCTESLPLPFLIFVSEALWSSSSVDGSLWKTILFWQSMPGIEQSKSSATWLRSWHFKRSWPFEISYDFTHLGSSHKINICVLKKKKKGSAI